jgi:hypothetical protein
MEVSSAPILRAAVIEQRYRGRLPRSLDDLAGPDHGTVQLPLPIAWSGLTTFAIERPPLCMSMYHIVLTEGLRDDLVAFLNPRLLVGHWPTLRGVVGRPIRDAWESAFPELAVIPRSLAGGSV